MRKTAGYCITGQERGGGNRYARIELSEKVCDSAGNTPLSGQIKVMDCSCWKVPECKCLIKSVCARLNL